MPPDVIAKHHFSLRGCGQEFPGTTLNMNQRLLAKIAYGAWGRKT